MKKVRKLLTMTVMLFVLMAAEGRGQSAVDGFNPDANSIVRSLAVQADGKIVVGGDFTAPATAQAPSWPKDKAGRLQAKSIEELDTGSL